MAIAVRADGGGSHQPPGPLAIPARRPRGRLERAAGGAGQPARARMSSLRNAMRRRHFFPSRRASILATAPIGPTRTPAFASSRASCPLRYGCRAARCAAQALAQAESEQFDSGLRAQRWRLAGEVREAYWQARLAATEQELAQRKVEEALRWQPMSRGE